MPTALLQIPTLIETQLKASPTIGVAEASIRRTKRRAVTKDNAPAVHIRATEVQRAAGAGKGDCARRTLRVIVTLIVRDDAVDSFDPILAAILARLAPGASGTTYPTGVTVALPRATVDEEMADEDVTRIDLEYEFGIGTGEHGLTLV